MKNGERIVQTMVFSSSHCEFPNLAKGMKEVLIEHGLWHDGMLMECNKKSPCLADATSCCTTHILNLQPDFKEQCSLVQEVIKAAGHLCIFLPKFHCELNFIEFFLGEQ